MTHIANAMIDRKGSVCVHGSCGDEMKKRSGSQVLVCPLVAEEESYKMTKKKKKTTENPFSILRRLIYLTLDSVRTPRPHESYMGISWKDMEDLQCAPGPLVCVFFWCLWSSDRTFWYILVTNHADIYLQDGHKLLKVHGTLRQDGRRAF